ncbi:hypothetical protein [Paraburkholderia sp. SIMBA_030]|uniref:hypothetical protein n=1 Tax=Paraburkholderia sp. SIMBA_030 TaxID=3085773 RepID=UPI00397A0D95
MNKLKNSHDLSLGITAFLTQQMDMPTRQSHQPKESSASPSSVDLARPDFLRGAALSAKDSDSSAAKSLSPNKRYTEAPALLRQLQGTIGCAMSANANFSPSCANSIVRYPSR